MHYLRELALGWCVCRPDFQKIQLTFEEVDISRGLGTLRECVPQPNSAREKGIEMTVDRGVGYQIVGVEGISVGTGGQNKVINWDVNVSRAGFEEEKKFRSGPALLKGDPAKNTSPLTIRGDTPEASCFCVLTYL